MAKRVFAVLLGLVSPSIVLIVGFWMFTEFTWEFPNAIGWLTMGIFLALLAAGIIWYFKGFKASGTWALPVGFLLPALIAVALETLFPPVMFQYVITIMITYFYSGPLVLITTIVFVILKIRSRTKAKANFQNA